MHQDMGSGDGALYLTDLSMDIEGNAIALSGLEQDQGNYEIHAHCFSSSSSNWSQPELFASRYKEYQWDYPDAKLSIGSLNNFMAVWFADDKISSNVLK